MIASCPCRYRLGVRTRGSQPRDRGSNPRTGTRNVATPATPAMRRPTEVPLKAVGTPLWRQPERSCEHFPQELTAVRGVLCEHAPPVVEVALHIVLDGAAIEADNCHGFVSGNGGQQLGSSAPSATTRSTNETAPSPRARPAVT